MPSGSGAVHLKDEPDAPSSGTSFRCLRRLEAAARIERQGLLRAAWAKVRRRGFRRGGSAKGRLLSRLVSNVRPLREEERIVSSKPSGSVR